MSRNSVDYVPLPFQRVTFSTAAGFVNSAPTWKTWQSLEVCFQLFCTLMSIAGDVDAYFQVSTFDFFYLIKILGKFHSAIQVSKYCCVL